MTEAEIRADERRRIAQEIRAEAHALRSARQIEERESGGCCPPSSPISPPSALALADWIESGNRA